MNKMNLVVILLCVFTILGSISAIVYLKSQLGKKQETGNNQAYLENIQRFRHTRMTNQLDC